MTHPKKRTTQHKPTEDELAKKTEHKGRAVVVTTAHRGVFYGWADTTEGDVIKLKGARLCLYWSADVQGFMGLAAKGPTDDCRIGPRADIEVRNITAVLEVTPEAIDAWEAAKWRP